VCALATDSTSGHRLCHAKPSEAHSLTLSPVGVLLVLRLQSRRQTTKLELYRRFTNTLAIAVVISVAWIGYEMYFKVTDQFNERWESDWVTGAFWHVLNFSLNVVICFLWRPSEAALQV
jgi:hypothetical protein